MKPQERLYRKLPELIKSILLTSEGWLVGSSINSLIEGVEVVDYDIVVPSRELFQVATKQISSIGVISVNSFGGIKFTDSIHSVDIWPEELDHFLKAANRLSYIYNFKKNILLKLE